jgi:hypothetical protein
MMKISVLICSVWMSITFCSGNEENKTGSLDDLSSKNYTYKTLSAYQKRLFDDFIENEFPTGTKISETLTNFAGLRTKTRLAEALLFRNSPGDKENAVTVLKWILKYQYKDENLPNYGIWRTSVSDDKLDQNWREFIGCDLIIIYHYYRNILPPDIVKEIENGLICAAKGALKRNVSADYSNISVMSAFLMEYTGTTFNLDNLKKAGLQKARDIYNLYRTSNTFSEYNSPTYYGVTLVGLALWRVLASDVEMKETGKKLEKEFWHEVTTFYNSNLKNMPGPYFRGYGMDMQKYYSIIGIWIAVAVDDETLSPLPKNVGAKYDEISNIAPIFHLGISLAESDLVMLKEFTSPRLISRTVPNSYKGDKLKKVTAMINKDWMMGGLWGSRRVWEQIKTGTIHWKTENGGTGWLLIPGDGKTNIKITENKMSIYLADTSAKYIELYLYAKNLLPDNFTDKYWKLPGLTMEISTTLERTFTGKVDPALFQKNCAVSETYDEIIKVTYQISPSRNPDVPLLEIIPKK